MKRLQKYNAIAIAIVTAAVGGMPLALAQEKADLVKFLKSTTDH